MVINFKARISNVSYRQNFKFKADTLMRKH